MPVITRIVQQKDENRVNIYLDGKFAFGITLEALLKNNLHKDQELTEQKIHELKNEDGVNKVYFHALDFVSRRPRSEREIKQWFYKKKVDEAVGNLVLQKLKEKNIINDEVFAKWWVEQRMSFRPKPKRALQSELIKKGIHKDFIVLALENIESNAELAMAKKLAEKKLLRLQGLPKMESKKKLANYLGGRGFDWEIIRQIFDELDKKR